MFAPPNQYVVQTNGAILSTQTNFPAMNAQTSNEFVEGDSWILDTRASHNMSLDVTLLTKATPYEGSEKIVIGW